MRAGENIGSSSAVSAAATEASSSPVPADPNVAHVLDAIDGDTLRVRLADGTVDKVRIIGIDTPETVDPRKPVQCFGEEASARMASLVAGKDVTLVKNPAEDRDIYQRLLRYVEFAGKDIGASMIADGYAFSYKTYPHPRLDQYNELEKAARSASKGLWGSCPSSSGQTASKAPANQPTPAPVAAPPPQTAPTSTATTQCVIKGNISAKGEKIYHLPGCGSYKQTVIDESAGERWFCTEAEAVAAGWRKAKNC